MTTDDQISRSIRAAADRLKAAGKKPTLKAVREALGGGSYATIQPVLKAWRDDQMAAPPAGMAKEILRYIDLDALVDHIRSQALADCAQRIEEAERERDATLIRSEELEAQVRALRYDRDTAAANLQDVTSRLRVAEHRVATLGENEARLHHELDRLAEVARENAVLEQTLHAYESRHHHQQQEIDRMAANADALREELVKRIERGAALEATVDHLEKQKAEQQDIIFQLQGMLATRK